MKLLGIDVGTTGVKALLIDESGEVLNQAIAEYPLSVPRPMWAEQDPELWWRAVQTCLGEIGEKPDAIGLTGQMHGAVFLDRDDKPIRPAILWNDQRTIQEVAEIDERVGPERLRDITCNPPLTGFQAPKILWLRNQEPHHFKQLRKVLLPKDYIRLRLTGDSKTEPSDASGTGLLDVPHRTWSPEIQGALDLDPNLFPPIAESQEQSGNTKQGSPVAAGAGDQAAAAVGTGAVEPGIISISLGTSGVVFASLDTPKADRDGALHTFCHANGKWHAMSVMLACGGSLRWYRDTFTPGAGYDELADEAKAAPAGCQGLTFLPYLTGERSPHNDPRARAGFNGITLAHKRSHFSRAVFEGITFGLLDGFQKLQTLGVEAKEIRVTGGGAKSDFWLQLLADTFNQPVATLENHQGPSFGAAILGGVSIGVWPDVQTACRTILKIKRSVEPSGTDYEGLHHRYTALYEAIKQWNKDVQ